MHNRWLLLHVLHLPAAPTRRLEQSIPAPKKRAVIEEEDEHQEEYLRNYADPVHQEEEINAESRQRRTFLREEPIVLITPREDEELQDLSFSPGSSRNREPEERQKVQGEEKSEQRTVSLFRLDECHFPRTSSCV